MTFEQFRRIQVAAGVFPRCGGRHRHHRAGRAARKRRPRRHRRLADVNPLAPQKPPLPAKAKNVIFMFMEGGPSQLDLFDPKPGLAKVERQAAARGHDEEPEAGLHQADAAVLASPRVFTPARAIAASSFRTTSPTSASCADDICLVRSMYTDAFNHHPGPVAAVQRHHAVRAVRPWAPGCSTGSAANRRTCRASWC